MNYESHPAMVTNTRLTIDGHEYRVNITIVRTSPKRTRVNLQHTYFIEFHPWVDDEGIPEIAPIIGRETSTETEVMETVVRILRQMSGKANDADWFALIREVAESVDVGCNVIRRLIDDEELVNGEWEPRDEPIYNVDGLIELTEMHLKYADGYEAERKRFERLVEQRNGGQRRLGI